MSIEYFPSETVYVRGGMTEAYKQVLGHVNQDKFEVNPWLVRDIVLLSSFDYDLPEKYEPWGVPLLKGMVAAAPQMEEWLSSSRQDLRLLGMQGIYYLFQVYGFDEEASTLGNRIVQQNKEFFDGSLSDNDLAPYAFRVLVGQESMEGVGLREMLPNINLEACLRPIPGDDEIDGIQKKFGERFLELLGFSGDEIALLFKSWESLYVDVDWVWEAMYKNMLEIARLEIAQEESSQRVLRVFGITQFARYGAGALEKQLAYFDNPDGRGDYMLVMSGRDDNNGALMGYREMWDFVGDSLSSQGMLPVFVEFGESLRELGETLGRVRERLGPTSLPSILSYHGKNGMPMLFADYNLRRYVLGEVEDFCLWVLPQLRDLLATRELHVDSCGARDFFSSIMSESDLDVKFVEASHCRLVGIRLEVGSGKVEVELKHEGVDLDALRERLGIERF